MSSRISPQTGLFAGGAGAAAVLGSLWLPWYTIRIPEAIKNAFGALGGASGPASSATPSDPGQAIAQGFGAMLKGLAAAIPSEITGDGWQTLGGADWALAIISGLALLAVLVAATGAGSVRADASTVGRLLAFAGAICALVAAYHVVKTPGTGMSGGMLGGLDEAISVRYGAYLAIVGGLVMVAGGVVAGRSGSLQPQVASTAFGDGEAPPAYVPPAPYTPPPAAAPAMADPFAAPAAPAVTAAADPFAAPAPVAQPVMPAAPRESGASVAPPGWAPPTAG